MKCACSNCEIVLLPSYDVSGDLPAFNLVNEEGAGEIEEDGVERIDAGDEDEVEEGDGDDCYIRDI